MAMSVCSLMCLSVSPRSTDNLGPDVMEFLASIIVPGLIIALILMIVLIIIYFRVCKKKNSVIPMTGPMSSPAFDNAFN